MIKVLIVEDDLDFGNLLKQYLELNNFNVQRVFNGLEAKEIIDKNTFDILLIDVMMPFEDGFSLAKTLPKLCPNIPFLFLTAKKLKEDVILGLQLGADDYIIKPFDVDELILRIKNILKRNNKIENNGFKIGDYIFKPDEYLLIYKDIKINLTEKESKIIDFLFQNNHKTIKREELLNRFWKESDFFSGRSLDVFMTRIRKKLSNDKTLKLESIRGIGFRIEF